MQYTITGLDAERFAPLFDLNDDELRLRNIVRTTVDVSPGYPCRISLEDAPVGETVLLLNYEHLSGDTPYRAAHAIYVRQGVARAEYTGSIPQVMRRRKMSLRAFDATGMLLDADLASGDDIDARLQAMLQNDCVAHVDLHYAKPGCFAGRAVRLP